MAYSETKVLIGGLAHVPVLIFIVNAIKNKFEAKVVDSKVIKVKEEELKTEEVKEEELKTEEVK